MNLPKYQLGFIGSLISAGASLLGGKLGQRGAKKRNEAQISSAREQMDFQKEMSDTAHQREIKDLRKAGLNPILSARYGGATTPPGAMPHLENEMLPLQEGINNSVSTALEARMNKATVKYHEAQAQKATAEAKRATAEVPKIEAETEKIADERDFLQANTRYHIGLDRKLIFDVVKIRNETLNTMKEFDVKVANEKEVLQRIKNLKQAYDINTEQLKHLVTKYPGLVTEQDIDESTYGEIIRYLGRINPFSTAPRNLGIIPFKK